ncbi:hypothetical protein [Cysteiniphilum litorale]|uniref:Uncharacterized protein n=2 Tax=Cysteiniphilum TaxID=2056696 RepID=A0A8J3E968_9GAMM|nr:hypothetical protein [Cysteiniphilum litorale]GGF99153.1 hypothetical protein GCM10010995_15540 [Cysteiniphilum litorale]
MSVTYPKLSFKQYAFNALILLAIFSIASVFALLYYIAMTHFLSSEFVKQYHLAITCGYMVAGSYLLYKAVDYMMALLSPCIVTKKSLFNDPQLNPTAIVNVE